MCRWYCSNLPNGTSTQSPATLRGLIRDTTRDTSGCGPVSDSTGTVNNLDPAPEAIKLTPGVVPAVDVVEARKAAIGDGAEVRRLLPQRTLRTIGAWCFLGRYWPGIGWLAAGTIGAGLAKTPCCAVSRPAAAAASVMSCGARG
jgi:hypothetical protein